MSELRLLIAGDFVYPAGSATAARVRNLAEGFVEAGFTCRVVGLNSSQPLSAARMEWREGKQAGVRYWIPASTAKGGGPVGGSSASRNRNWRDRLLWFLQAYLRAPEAGRHIQRLFAMETFDLMLLYGRSGVRLRPLLRTASRRRITCLLDVTEIPESFSGVGGCMSPVSWDWKWGMRMLPDSVSGLTVITTALAERFQNQGYRRVLVVPATEAWEESPPADSRLGQGPFRMLYVGSLIPRDNPSLLFEIMRHLARSEADVVLDIAGRYEDYAAGRAEVAALRQDPLLQSRVRLLGRLSDTALHQAMRDADALVLTRQDSPTEVCAFPTRLVEYLKQAHPVCVAAVGDIALYLRHGVDAVLLDPRNPRLGAEAIGALVALPDRGRSLGLQGWRRGRECFNRRVHARRIASFAESLQSSSSEGDQA